MAELKDNMSRTRRGRPRIYQAKLVRGGLRKCVLKWLADEGFQRCARCETVKTVGDFPPSTRECRECCRVRANAQYRESEKKREYCKSRSQKQVESGWALWWGIIRRCEDKKCVAYKDYGGRGISVHPSWRDSPEPFFEHIGPRPSPAHSVERINNDGNYEPGNVRWATSAEQARNKRSTVRVIVGEKTFALCDLARAIGVDARTLKRKLSGCPELPNTAAAAGRA